MLFRSYLGRIVEGCELLIDDDDALYELSDDQTDDVKQRVEMAQAELSMIYSMLGGSYVAIVDMLIEDLESMDRSEAEAAAERVKEMLEEMLSRMKDDDSVDDDGLEPMA